MWPFSEKSIAELKEASNIQGLTKALEKTSTRVAAAEALMELEHYDPVYELVIKGKHISDEERTLLVKSLSLHPQVDHAYFETMLPLMLSSYEDLWPHVEKAIAFLASQEEGRYVGDGLLRLALSWKDPFARKRVAKLLSELAWEPITKEEKADYKKALEASNMDARLELESMISRSIKEMAVAARQGK